MRLPSEIQTILKERGRESDPQLSVRALNSLSGELGEVYTFVDGAELVLFSRQVGKQFEETRFTVAELARLGLDEDRPFAYLRFQAQGTEYKLKFSGMEIENLKALLAVLRSEREGAIQEEIARPRPPTLPPTQFSREMNETPEAELKLTPVVGFCAAIYAMIQADSSIDDEELELLNKMINHPPTVLKGLDALRRFGTVELFKQLNDMMTEPQKLCLMANLIEMSMVDGLVRGQERKLLRQVRKAIGIDKTNFDAIFEVLMVKNDRSIFEIQDA